MQPNLILFNPGFLALEAMASANLPSVCAKRMAVVKLAFATLRSVCTENHILKTTQQRNLSEPTWVVTHLHRALVDNSYQFNLPTLEKLKNIEKH